MKRKTIINACIGAVALMTTAACGEKDLYDAGAAGKAQEPKAESAYFDFATRHDIDLRVDLGMAGAGALIEVYAENPFNTESYARNDAEAIFKVYADDKGKWSGTMAVPTAAETLYLLPNAMGLPVMAELQVVGGAAAYVCNQGTDGSKQATRGKATTRGEQPLYTVDAGKGIYALCQWTEHGVITAPGGYLADAGIDASWTRKIQSTFWNGGSSRPNHLSMDNTNYITDVAHVNTTISKYARNEDGTVATITEASVYFTFLDESAWNQNAIGYYYYPGGEVPASPSDVKRIILFPNASTAGNVPFVMLDHENEKYASPQSGTSPQWLYRRADAPLKMGNKVKLLYQQPDGTVTDKFPAGYTIGYFIISNGFGNGYNTNHKPYDLNLNVGESGNKGYIYSNQAWNTNGKSSFVAITDSETGRVVYGIEDGTDKSYEDVLFCVEADPSGSIYDPDRPVVPIDDNTTATEKYSGTLLYEDIWPTGGDYDMNDVIVEYTRAITFDEKNKVVEINDTFCPVWDGATYKNAFAYQIAEGQLGTFTLPEGAVYEEGTRSIVVFPDVKAAQNRKVTVKRTFDKSISKTDIKAYNPFIIVNYQEGAVNRQEVHLPKRLPTAWADHSLNYSEDDAYYINKDGKYPFAMDIPVHGFKPVTERMTIGSEGEYPGFTHWVNGEAGYGNWYEQKQ